MRGPDLLRRHSMLLLAVLVPCLVAGCTAGPSQPLVGGQNARPSTPGTSTIPPVAPMPPLDQPQAATVAWSDCGDETRSHLEAPAVPADLALSCAEISSVLDAPDLPGRAQTHIALLKAGTGPVPLLVLNDADGEPGTYYAAHLAAQLPATLLRTFSLVGVDRRGTGESDPVGCVPPEVHAPLLSQDPAGGDLESVLDAARRAGQQCAIELSNAQQAMDSWRSAGDLDQVREDLGVPRLNAIVRGEAADVLTAYLNRFPDRVGRVVFDGIPDPSTDPATVLGDLAAAQQATLEAFGADCAARGCALGADATGAVTALLDQLRETPQRIGGGVRMSPGMALNAVLAGLANRARWPELADAVQAARTGGDPAQLAAFVAPMLNGSQLTPSRLDGALATECNDTATRLPANQISALTDTLRQRAPLFGGLVTQRLAWCLPWPGRTDPLPTLAIPGLPPILVASTRTDPVTPEQGTVRAAQQMPSAVRVSWQGTAHGAMTSPCIGATVQAFLVDGKVPSDGTLCPA